MLENGPVVVVETFVSTVTRNIVDGPAGEPGSSNYVNNGLAETTQKNLVEVIAHPTSHEYAYCFSDAHVRPHFVISHDEFKKYLSKVVLTFGMNCKLHVGDFSTLHKPTMLKHSDNNPNFYFFGAGTAQFQAFFGDPPIDVDWFMDRFDKKLYNPNENENRGFKDVLDIGFGHYGACKDSKKDQVIGSDYVCARPTLINLTGNEEEYRALGPMLDQMQLFSDAKETGLREDNCKLFSCEKRRTHFVLQLRHATGAKIFRGEAVTVLRQKVGTVTDLEANGTMDFEKTLRHR